MRVSQVIVLSLLVSISQCAKILGIFPMAATSHYILGSSLMKGLAEKGHDVTIIAPYKEKNPPKNITFRSIDVPSMIEFENHRRKQMSFFDMIDFNPIMSLPLFVKLGFTFTEVFLSDSNVQEFLKTDEQFDVVIVEQFMNDALKGFASHFKAPLISFSTIGANTWVNMLSGNPAPPSYIPDIFLSFSSDMSFWERMSNVIYQSCAQLMINFYSFPKHRELYEKHFPKADPFYDVLYNSSLYLLNSHSSINQPVPLVPSFVEIGGFHIKAPQKLPEDLQEFLDGASDGVIYFSMGSNIKSREFPQEKREAFLKAFAKLKQRVLWKWEDDDLPGKPDNVKIGKWLPQQDILAHPNVKLFISHGGLLSTTETIYHGVPVMSIPIFGDQKVNAQRMVNNGFGVILSYKEISEEVLAEKLSEILNNPKYSKNAKARSQLFHDRLESPMEKAIYWVEYIIRHKGAEHLKVSGVDLPLYKYFLLDVIAFVLLIVIVIFKAIKYVCSFCCRRQRTGKLKQN